MDELYEVAETKEERKSFSTVISEMQENEKAMKAESRKSILTGLLLLAVGVGASFVWFLLTKPGGTYRIFTGAIVIGAFGAIKGIVSYISLLIKTKKYETETWTKRLGHTPTNTDDEYVQFKSIVHPPAEKVKTILAFVLVIACIAVMGYMGYIMATGNVPHFGTSQEEYAEMDRLYEELVELDEKLAALDLEITKYENQLQSLQDQYLMSPSEELEAEYDELYDKYADAVNEYNSTLEIFNEKYTYFDETYGFGD